MDQLTIPTLATMLSYCSAAMLFGAPTLATEYVYGTTNADEIVCGDHELLIGGSWTAQGFKCLVNGTLTAKPLSNGETIYLYPGAGSDSVLLVNSSSGAYSISASSRLVAITSAIPGGATTYGGDGNDDIEGWDFADTIWGDAGDDHISGRGGSVNYLYGGTGHDTIAGGDGADRISGWGTSGGDGCEEWGCDTVNGACDICAGFGGDDLIACAYYVNGYSDDDTCWEYSGTPSQCETVDAGACW